MSKSKKEEKAHLQQVRISAAFGEPARTEWMLVRSRDGYHVTQGSKAYVLQYARTNGFIVRDSDSEQARLRAALKDV